jgi:Xaa-Pro dipeptidase
MTTAAAAPPFGRIQADLDAIREQLRSDRLDGWLLYGLRMRNPVASALLEQGDVSRRYFVYLPAEGEPTAIIHGIEVAPWHGWPWQRRVYGHWSELEEALGAVLGGSSRVAMEYSALDAVPMLDLVPAGVVELVRWHGTEVVSSGDLVTRFYSRWTAEDLASHERSAKVLAETAAAAFDWLAARVGGGEATTEGAFHDYVIGQLQARGAGEGADCIGATGRNAADPHYHPSGEGARFERGDLVLLDLWARENEQGIFADQTWMGYLGAEVPAREAELFAAIRDGREAAVRYLEEAWAAGRPVQGAEVDDATRGVLRARNLAQYFIHRTGHSIDRNTHGAGPNIDNHETREMRLLVPGIGFSIEPGIYIADDIGMRTEINMYIGEQGPVVTTPNRQSSIAALLPG